jgi:hypothetical protein
VLPSDFSIGLLSPEFTVPPSASSAALLGVTVSLAFVPGTQAGGTVKISRPYLRPFTYIPSWPWVIWENAAAFTPAEISAGLSAPDRDAAGDGVPNLLKFALGHNSPRTPLPVALRPQAGTDAAGALTLTFQRADATLIYAVEASSDLAAWTLVALNLGSVGGSVTVADPAPAGQSRRFLRLRVSLP